MSLIGIILSPFGLIWGIVSHFKRRVYDTFNLRKKGALPNIVIGNLSVGGSGKTPTVIWLLQQLTRQGIQKNQIGILSRGYQRKSQGFVWVNSSETFESVGDEPLEIQSAISAVDRTIAVCENRLTGLSRMKKENDSLKITVLDDGYQHLRLQPDMSILICDYHRLFTREWPLPFGKLREFPWEAKNADAVLISNCPKSFCDSQQTELKNKLLTDMKRWMFVRWPFSKNNTPKWKNCIGFLSTVTTTPKNPLTNESLIPNSPIYLITGIANPHRVVSNLCDYSLIKHEAFNDHHSFDKKCVSHICKQFEGLVKSTPNLVIVATRKDWVKIQRHWPHSIPIFIVSSVIEPLHDTENMIQKLLTPFIHENKLV